MLKLACTWRLMLKLMGQAHTTFFYELKAASHRD